MNHHLNQQDFDWIESQGEFAITGFRSSDPQKCREARVQELDARIRLLVKFAKKLNRGNKEAAEYFEVSFATWRAWCCGDKTPPASICFHIEKITGE